MAQELMIKVPDNGVHVIISRGYGNGAINLKELVYSHILLAVRASFGREAQFHWVDPQDWVIFCAGEEIMVEITGAKLPTIATVRHGNGRVVYVNPVVVAVAEGVR